MREHAGAALGFMTDAQWAQKVTGPVPDQWARVLLDRWSGRHGANRRAANLDHLRRCRDIAKAHRAGVPADSDDDALVAAASTAANDAGRRLRLVEQIAAGQLADREPEQRERMTMLACVLEALHWLDAQGLAEKFVRRCYKGIPGALKRVEGIHFWRKALRTMHARAVESTARAIGLVSKNAGIYASNDSVKRRRSQLVRGEAVLNSVLAVNEHGQEMALAELAAKGPANREIRRHELMTRIAGFEFIAKQCDHDAYFVTVTCPSRMHAVKTVRKSWRVVENSRFDGSTPRDGQEYLADQWGKFRSACARWGVTPYGFRIAEPNHDGTPHWHALLFLPRVVVQGENKKNARVGRPVAGRVMLRLLRDYFLRNTDPGEKGARKHRVVVEKIDWTRGSAAGYVAKYVAKNIDGYKVEKDLHGNDALTSSMRVDAWASTWGVRQFQQIGGAPVGVWREARRLHPEQGGAAHAILMALDAVNAASLAPADSGEAVRQYTAATGWAEYNELQGGIGVKRKDLRVTLLKEQSGELGRYGELLAPRSIGVQTADARQQAVAVIGRTVHVPRTVTVEVESERATWVIVDGSRERVPGQPGQWRNKPGAEARIEAAQRRALAQGEALRPWSPVNNCTRAALYDVHPTALFGHSVERTPKRGRWHQWKTRAGGAQPARKVR